MLQVVAGQGIDRHLLGLKLCAVEKGIDIPDFFVDPVYNESCHWKLSTSQVCDVMNTLVSTVRSHFVLLQVPSRHNSLLTFGPVVPDGYGICYNPMPQQINFAVSAWRSCADTNAQTLMDSLHKSLEDARDVLTKTSAKL